MSKHIELRIVICPCSVGDAMDGLGPGGGARRGSGRGPVPRPPPRGAQPTVLSRVIQQQQQQTALHNTTQFGHTNTAVGGAARGSLPSCKAPGPTPVTHHINVNIDQRGIVETLQEEVDITDSCVSLGLAWLA